jgi:hypothetical protein
LTFKIGAEERELIFVGNTVKVSLDVGTSHNGKKMTIYRSSNNGVSYTAQGTCTVSAGICSFFTNKFSLFILYTENPVSAG